MPTNEVETTIGKVLEQESQALTALLDEALKSALKAIDEYELNADNAFDAIMLEGKKEAENVKRKMLGSAELQARNLQLSAYEEFFGGVIKDALEAISSLPRDSRYEKAMVALLRDAIAELDEGKYSVSCVAKDAKAVSDALEEVKEEFPRHELVLSRKHLDGAGGFVLKSKDGTIELDDTFEARLERMKPNIRKRVYERYFKEVR
jgi:V/A-type H+-transporting ATPase subunit E